MVRKAVLNNFEVIFRPNPCQTSPAQVFRGPPKVVYFAQDLGDPAVKKRVRMLCAGGACVSTFGFQRGQVQGDGFDCMRVVDLGRTFDGRLGQRAVAVARAIVALPQWRDIFRDADIFMARNLEMLMVAAQARRYASKETRFVYECLDIHRSLVGEGPRARLLRRIERSLLSQCHLLIVSSPAFLKHHFDRYSGVDAAPLIVENKILQLGESRLRTEPRAVLPPGPPWRIGWFGVIRAQKALDTLCSIAEQNKRLVEIVIRGQPALRDFRDFAGQVGQTPGMMFHGPYASGDLQKIYDDVHFIWAFDYLDEGGNSSWLLPNRLYEGGRYGAVALAAKSTQTGRWLANRGSGVLFDDPVAEIGRFLQRLTPEGYADLRRAAQRVPTQDLVADRADCEALIAALFGQRILA